MVRAHQPLVIPSLSRDLGSEAKENNLPLSNCPAKILRLRTSCFAQNDIFEPFLIPNSSFLILKIFQSSDLPRDQHRFFVHGDEAEVFSCEADAAFLQGDHDLLRAVALQAAVLLDEELPVTGEREPRQTVQTEGRNLQPLRREINDFRDAAHKTTSGA